MKVEVFSSSQQTLKFQLTSVGQSVIPLEGTKEPQDEVDTSNRYSAFQWRSIALGTVAGFDIQRCVRLP
jgi:hypothetical protein